MKPNIVLVADCIAANRSGAGPETKTVIGPPPLEVFRGLGKVEEEFPQYLRTHPTLNDASLLKERQNVASIQWNRKRKLVASDGVEWTIKHRALLARIELAVELSLSFPQLIHGLRKDKKGWHALVWIRSSELATVELEDSFISDYLTNQGIKSTYYMKSDFCQVSKYDVRSILDSTHFRSGRKVGPMLFELTDIFGSKVQVDYNWAVSNIPKGFLDGLKHGGCSEIIPHGNSRKLSNSHDNKKSSCSTSNNMPVVEHINNEGEHKCLVKALASGVAFLGYKCEASILSIAYDKTILENNQRQFPAFLALVRSIFKAPFNKGRFNPLDPQDRRPNPLVMVLKSSITEGSVTKPVFNNHAVCIVGDYLFDPNRERAMILSRESLNEICDSIVPGSFYNGIYWSRELKLNRNATIVSGIPQKPPKSSIQRRR